MRFSLLLASALMASASLAAHADTYQYNVVFNNGSNWSDATFNSSSILTSTTFNIPATGTSNIGSVLSVGAHPLLYSCDSGLFACFITDFNDGADILFFNSNVDSVGTFTDAYGHGTVTITDIPAPTPEPSSLLLLGSGLLGLGGVCKRRWRLSAAE